MAEAVYATLHTNAGPIRLELFLGDDKYLLCREFTKRSIGPAPPAAAKHAEARPLSTIAAPGDNAIKCPDYNQLWPNEVLARPGSWQSTCSINLAAARPLSP